METTKSGIMTTGRIQKAKLTQQLQNVVVIHEVEANVQFQILETGFAKKHAVLPNTMGRYCFGHMTTRMYRGHERKDGINRQ